MIQTIPLIITLVVAFHPSTRHSGGIDPSTKAVTCIRGDTTDCILYATTENFMMDNGGKPYQRRRQAVLAAPAPAGGVLFCWLHSNKI
jgi:hypothetical protein